MLISFLQLLFFLHGSKHVVLMMSKYGSSITFQHVVQTFFNNHDVGA